MCSILFFSIFIPLQAQDATIIGTVTDSISSLPISGAHVEAIRGNIVRYSTTTAMNGTYTLPNVDPGNYTLTFNASGYQTYTVGVIAKNNQTAIVNASLVPNGGTISGIVTNAMTSMPIAGASVLVFQNATLIVSQTTNAGGMYTISDLAPGVYIVLVTASNFQEQLRGVTVSAGMTSTLNFALQPNPGALSGQVTDAHTSNPIQDAQIEVFIDSILIGFANSDSNGNYTISNLTPGNYVVVVTCINFNSQSIGVAISPNTTTILNFALTQPPGTIAGSVIDANTSNPIPGATVAVFQDEIFIMSELTDPNGMYELSGLAPGDYFVVVQTNNYQSSGTAASVSAAHTTTVNFSLLLNPGMISGTITDATTTDPVPGARILIFSESQLITFGVSDTNGEYTIPNLSPGTYLVLVRANDYEAAFSSEIVMSGATTISDFALNLNPGSIEGVILNLCDGSAVPGALVVVTDGSIIVGFTLTDSNGNYRIENLAPGNYTVAAAKQNFLINSASATVLSNTSTPINLSLTPRAFPPETVRGEVIKNRFLTQTDQIHAIFWTASPGFCVTGYEIFRNNTLIAFIPASAPLTYMDHNRKSTDVYTVKTINSLGQSSAGVSISLP